MSGNEQLFDLSLFAFSPTDDRHFAVSGHQRYDEPVQAPRDYRRPSQGTYAEKPLPALPPRRVCPRVSVSRNHDIDSPCILARIKRTVTPPSNTRDNTLLQRRQPTATPRLTLSVPQSNPGNRNAASAMVWLPDAQMWLIENEVQGETLLEQTAYPSPPAYSPRRNPAIDRSRSAPSTSIPPPSDLTPPLTPVQCQLRSLIQPPEDERLSPLFHEAMSSVPMEDSMDIIYPPFDPSPQQNLRPQSAQTSYETSTPYWNQESLCSWLLPVRSSSVGSGISSRSSNSSSDRSFHSAHENISKNSSQPSQSVRGWQGLAKRIARSSTGSRS